jgi:hypothetical protein
MKIGESRDAPLFSLLSFGISSLEHFSKDQTLNRGSHLPGYAACEFHPGDETGSTG